MEWLSSNTIFCLTQIHACKMAEKKKWDTMISQWLFLRWFQHDIYMVLRNEDISCFIHKPIRV